MDQHAWTEDGSVTTISVVQRAGVADVLDVLGLTASEPRRTTLPKAAWENEVLIDVDGGWTVVLEPNNALGVTPQIVQAMSRVGRHVALYRSVNADMAFVSAQGGVETRRFDSLDWPDEQRGEPLAEEDGLTFGRPGLAYQQAVVLLEGVTGIQLTRQWLYELLRTAYDSTEGGCRTAYVGAPTAGKCRYRPPRGRATAPVVAAHTKRAGRGGRCPAGRPP